jgi:hypothetical protein
LSIYQAKRWVEDFFHSDIGEKKRLPGGWGRQNKSPKYLLNTFEDDNRPVVPEKNAS